MAKFEHLKSLISHENLNPTYSELLELALDAIIEKTEKKKGIYEKPQHHQGTYEKPAKNELIKEAPTKEAPTKEELNNPKTESVKSAITTQGFAVRSSRYIPRQVRKFVLKRRSAM